MLDDFEAFVADLIAPARFDGVDAVDGDAGRGALERDERSEHDEVEDRERKDDPDACVLAGGRALATVADDGPGFPEDLLPRLGEPFLGPSFSGSGSTGLGIFIATTLLERTGARLSFANAAQGGATVEIRWARADIEVAARLPMKDGTG